jgi:hypothetical protein
MVRNWTQFLNESNNIDDIISDIKDICLELQDKGFIVKFNMKPQMNRISVHRKSHIVIRKFRNKFFDSNDILEVIERLRNYMEDNGYETKVFPYDLIDEPEVDIVWINFNKKVDIDPYRSYTRHII